MDSQDRIKQLRETLGYKQGEFADILLMKQGSYSDVERKRVGVSARTLKFLEEKFNVSADWIRTGEGDIFMAHTPDLADRIKDILNHYKLNYHEFADQLGLQGAEKDIFMANLQQGKDSSTEMINKICKVFPDINRKYLLSGMGNLLTKGRANLTFVKDSDEINSLKEQVVLYKKITKMYENEIIELKNKLNGQ
jgi:transcriptional regulator with XRE-family HTH domain